MFYVSLKKTNIGGETCFVSQEFRPYSLKGNRNVSNFKYIKAAFREYGIDNYPHGVYIIFKGDDIVYIGHSEGNSRSMDVVRACQRHFQTYNDKNRRRRVELDRAGYRVQFILPQTKETGFSLTLEKNLIALYKPKENSILYIKDSGEYSDKELKEFIKNTNVDFSKDLLKTIKTLKRNNRDLINLEDEEEVEIEKYQEFRKIFSQSQEKELPLPSSFEEIKEEDIPF